MRDSRLLDDVHLVVAVAVPAVRPRQIPYQSKHDQNSGLGRRPFFLAGTLICELDHRTDTLARAWYRRGGGQASKAVAHSIPHCTGTKGAKGSTYVAQCSEAFPVC